MSDSLLTKDEIVSCISTDLVPTLIALRALGVSQLDADLTEMSIRLRLPPRAEQVHLSITSNLQTTDRPEAG